MLILKKVGLADGKDINITLRQIFAPMFQPQTGTLKEALDTL